SSWDWARVADMLEPSFRVLTFDFLGFGDSDKPRNHVYSINEQADLTEALWRRLGLAETGLLGHDSRATVAPQPLPTDREKPLKTRLSGVPLPNAGLYLEPAR